MAKVDKQHFNKKINKNQNDPRRKKSIPIQGSSALASSVGGCFLLAVLLVSIFSGCEPAYADVDTTRAVIHHTVSHDVSAAEIDRWHKERGWDGIGYHFVIRKDGTVEEGRSLQRPGAHAKGRNHWVGIALTGYDKFTDRQRASLRVLLSNLGTTHIEKHHEQCPGEGLKLEEIQ